MESGNIWIVIVGMIIAAIPPTLSSIAAFLAAIRFKETMEGIEKKQVELKKLVKEGNGTADAVRTLMGTVARLDTTVETLANYPPAAIATPPPPPTPTPEARS